MVFGIAMSGRSQHSVRRLTGEPRSSPLTLQHFTTVTCPHVSTEAAVASFLQLIEIFLDNGIVTAEVLRKRLQPYFSD